MRRRCSRSTGLAALVGLSAASGAARAGRHAATCLRCQLDLARRARVGRLLGQLLLDAPEIPDSLLRDILASVASVASATEAPADAPSRRVRRAVVLTGLGVLGLAAGVLAARHPALGRGA
jgi:hypothetical protein